MIDFSRLRQDALYVVDNYEGAVAGTVAAALLRILDEPWLAVPEGYALVKKPELLGKGVPTRHG